MDDGSRLIAARATTRGRAAPAASDAVAFTGGIGIALGVLLLSVNFASHGDGRPPGVALFAALLVAGYIGLWVLPKEAHPAAVTCIVIGVPGALGWWILPHAHRFADVRPFLILVIVVWAALYFAPRTSGRTIFVAAALIVLWLWILGEVVGTDAYSASPVPSPPAHTLFSVAALTQRPHPSAIETRAGVTLGELPTNSPYYPEAALCGEGEGAACDSLFNATPPSSPFHTFADTCGNTRPAGSGGACATLEGNGNGFGSTIPIGGNLSPLGSGLVPPVVGVGTHDKSFQIGIVSLLFGLAYLGALWAFDRRRWSALGTAMVVPTILALFTGTEVLGNAAHHAWFGGLLTFVAGITFAIVGDVGGRRFSAWAGGVFAAFGGYTIAVDVGNLKSSFTSENVHLVRPALISMGAGAVLVAIALIVAVVRSRLDGPAIGRPPAPPAPPSPSTPPPAPATSTPWLPAPPGPWQQGPSAPPPSAPWQPPAAPPPPWQPPPGPPPSPGGPPT
jgi:hypothetical protein